MESSFEKESDTLFKSYVLTLSPFQTISQDAV